MDWIKENYNVLIENPLILSLIIILGSIIVAKITDLVFTVIIKRITARTHTELDDKIVVLFHKPIFYSILFVGFSMGVKTANLPDYIDFALVGIFKTITIIIWLFLISRILILSIDWASKQTYIALGNMMTSAALIGIDSCPIEGFHQEKTEALLREKFGVDTDKYGLSYMAAFGYRKTEPQFEKSRRNFEDIVTWK